MAEKIRDSRDMDPVFEQVVKSLYGESVDPRALWKAMPDQSSMHVPGAAQKKKERRIAATGLAASGVAGVGGIHALGMTGKNALGLRSGYKAKHAVETVAPKMFRKLPISGKTAAVLGTAGWLGLHTTELVGDALGARAQMRAIKQNQPGKPKPLKGVKQPKAPTTVAKGVFKPSRATKEVIRQANVRAAKKGQKALLVTAGAGSTIGGAAGGYAATKKYRLAKIPPQSSTVVQAAPAMKVKKNDELDFTWEGQISKVDQDKRLVFGWCSLSKVNGEPVVDLQGDYIPIDETESSAYKYVIESRKGGDMHRRVSKFDVDEPLHTADLVESMVFTPEKLVKMGLAPDALPHGWWIGMKVNDDSQWAAVKAGQRLGFSIHGKGRRVEKAL